MRISIFVPIQVSRKAMLPRNTRQFGMGVFLMRLDRKRNIAKRLQKLGRPNPYPKIRLRQDFV